MNAPINQTVIPSTLTTNDPAFDEMANEVHSQQRWCVPYLGTLEPAQRFAALKALANNAGLRLPETIVPEGTPLIPYGEERKRALAADLNKLPDLAPALDAYTARLVGEAHKDVNVPLHTVRMVAPSEHGALANGRGRLIGPGSSTPLAYTDAGFRHVAAYLKPDTIRNGFAENLLALPLDLRSTVFNHWATNSKRHDNVVVRTFWGGKDRIVRAVTSPKHSLETGDDMAIVAALRTARPGAKVRITRGLGGEFSQIEVIWPMLDRQLVAGDVAYGGVRISNSETKGGSLRVEAFLLRVLCLNFTTAFTEDENVAELSLRHVGDLTKRLARMVMAAMDRIDPFVQAFGDAYKDGLPDFAPTRAAVLERAQKKALFSESVLHRANELWDADGLKSAGDTRAGFVNALTRASQELEVNTATVVERQAGRVILDGWDALS